jgi:hypothetical protein
VKAVFFPLDQQLKLLAKNWSEGVVKLVVWLSGLVDYESAQQVLQEVGQIHISTSSVWRQAQAWGEQFRLLESRERVRASVLPMHWLPGPGEQEKAKRMGAALDGGMIHIRDEGWKEFKVGSVFEVEMGLQRDEETGEMVERAHAVNNSYVAHLGGPEVFGQMLWAEAARRGWEQAAETEVIGDGAPWIWNLALEHFYDSRQVVDWYHATEHLAAAAKLLKGEGTLAARRWFKAQGTVLYQGQASEVASILEAEAEQNPALAEVLTNEALPACAGRRAGRQGGTSATTSGG